MFIEFSTTITHRVEIGDDGLKGISHSAEIDASGDISAFPGNLIYAIVSGGCKATIKSVEGKAGKTFVEIEEVDPDGDED